MARKSTARGTPARTAKAPVHTPEMLDKLRQWIVSGETEHQISERIAATWVNVKPQPLIVAALQAMADNAAVNVDLVYGWCFEATREIHRRAIEAEDYPTALRAVKQLIDLARVKP